MTPEDLAGWLAEQNPSFCYSPGTAGGSLFTGEPPRDVVPCAAVALSDTGVRFSVQGGPGLSSYELYDADIRVQTGGNAQKAYLLGRQLLESVMGIKGGWVGGTVVAGCELRAPVAIKRAADGVYTAAFCVRLTALRGSV